MTNLANYASTVGDGNMPVLGSILWYSVSKVKIEHDAFVELLKGTPFEGTSPACPADHDVFRRVCSKAEQRKIPTDKEGVSKNVLIRNVASGKEEMIIRRIVVEEVSTTTDKRLDYRQIIDVTFNKSDGTITLASVPTVDHASEYDPIAKVVANDIINEYHAQRKCFNSYAIQQWIRRRLIDMHSTKVNKSGAVYFLSAAYSDQLEELEKLIYALPGFSEIHPLPLIDTTKQREMVRAAFEAESVGEIDELLIDMFDILQDPDKKITEAAFNQLGDRYSSLIGKVEDYNGLLQTNLNEVTSRLTLFEQKLKELGPRIKIKKGGK